MFGGTTSLLFQSLALSGSAPEENREIKIGEKFSLCSEILDQDRPYWVYLPSSYDDPTYAPQSYPVLYLLDGEDHFHSASGVVHHMSAGIGGNIQIPELIIVAIPNTNRTRDLTPTHSNLRPDGVKAEFLGPSGGGDAFLGFLRDELFPRIDSTYRTLPYRILVGHSFGGLMALYALLDVPEMFQLYVAIDPSLWWDNQAIAHRAERELENDPDRRACVYISLANSPKIVGRSDPERMAEGTRTFAKALQAVPCSGVRSMLQYYEAEDHGSVPLQSLYHGLLYIFEGYKPNITEFLEQPALLDDHFGRISERLGVDLLPPEAFVDRNGMSVLRVLEDVDKAIEFFKLNVANYPGSYHAYDSLAGAYAVKGETALAVENYKKSLELNPDNQNATKRLQELTDGQTQE